jgi:hypothetical protein
MITVNKLEEAVLEYIRTHIGSSCVELYRTFGKGDYWLTVGNNVVYAFGLSDELSEALSNLEDMNEIVSMPCEWVIYLVDGGIPKLPMAHKIPKTGYKEPHWLPSCYYTYDHAVKQISEKYRNKPEQKQMLLELMENSKQTNELKQKRDEIYNSAYDSL